MLINKILNLILISIYSENYNCVFYFDYAGTNVSLNPGPTLKLENYKEYTCQHPPPPPKDPFPPPPPPSRTHDPQRVASNHAIIHNITPKLAQNIQCSLFIAKQINVEEF